MANYYWKDGADDDFFSRAAWVPEAVPGEFNSAFVAVAGTYTVTVSAEDAGQVFNLTFSNANATLAVNGGALEVDEALATAGAIVLDNGPYHGAYLSAYSIESAGPISVDAYDGSGGAGLYVAGGFTLGGPLVVGNVDLSASTNVTARWLMDEADVTVVGPDQLDAAAKATVSFQYYYGASELDDTVTISGNAELDGFPFTSIGATGVLSMDGAESRIDGIGEIVLPLNQGTIALDDSADLTISASFDNAGQITVENGALLNFYSSVGNSGTISMVNDVNDVAPDGGLYIDGDLTNDGQIYVNNDSAEYVNVEVFGAFDNQGSFILDNAIDDPAATTYAKFGSLQNSGLFEIGGGFADDTVQVTGTATATKNVMEIGDDASFSASLVMTGTADLDVTGGAVSGAVVAENSAVALVQAGTFSNVSTTLINGGTEIVSSGPVEGPSIAAANLYLGEGATLSSPVSFTPSGGTIALFRSSLPTLQVDGLSPLAQVDVFDVPYALGSPPPILLNTAQQQNVLQFSDAHGGLVDLQLDPKADYSGVRFIVQPYLNGVAISEAS